MAWATVKKELDTITKLSYNRLERYSLRYKHKAVLAPIKLAKAMKIGVDNLLKGTDRFIMEDELKHINKINTTATWLTAVNKTIKKLNKGPGKRINGTYYVPVRKAGKSTGYFDKTPFIPIIVFFKKNHSVPKGQIEKTINYIKDEVYDEWVTSIAQGAIGATKSGKDLDWGKGSSAPQTSHRTGTTVASAGIIEELKRIVKDGDLDCDLKDTPITSIDLIEGAMTGVTIRVKTNPTAKSWRIRENREVILDIATKNPKLPDDWTEGYKKIVKWSFWTELQKFKLTNPKFAAEAEASQSFSMYTARYYNAKMRKDIKTAFGKNIKRVSGETETSVPRRKRINESYKPDSSSNVIKRSSLSISSKGNSKLTEKKVEKGTTGVEEIVGAGGLTALQRRNRLLLLTGEINTNLTEAVEARMGKDGALTRRKGRFSGSVKLKSLHEAPKTIVAKYTYMLSPYETFENTGKRRWRHSYNPKKLIVKAIRDLAEDRIKQKFNKLITMRRV